MNRLILVAALLALPVAAHAQSGTIELPTSTVGVVQQFFLHPPAKDRIDPGDVVQFLQEIQGCAAMQTPVNGVTRDRGECTPVTTAIAQRAAAQDAAVKAAVAAAVVAERKAIATPVKPATPPPAAH